MQIRSRYGECGFKLGVVRGGWVWFKLGVVLRCGRAVGVMSDETGPESVESLTEPSHKVFHFLQKGLFILRKEQLFSQTDKASLTFEDGDSPPPFDFITENEYIIERYVYICGLFDMCYI